MHHAPVAEGDAAQADRQGAGRQALQLREGAAHLHVALLDTEPGAARMAEALRRAEVRAQRRMEGQLPDNFLQPWQQAPSSAPHDVALRHNASLPTWTHMARGLTVGGKKLEGAPAGVACTGHKRAWRHAFQNEFTSRKLLQSEFCPGLKGTAASDCVPLPTPSRTIRWRRSLLVKTSVTLQTRNRSRKPLSSINRHLGSIHRDAT